MLYSGTFLWTMASLLLHQLVVGALGASMALWASFAHRIVTKISALPWTMARLCAVQAVLC